MTPVRRLARLVGNLLILSSVLVLAYTAYPPEWPWPPWRLLDPAPAIRAVPPPPAPRPPESTPTEAPASVESTAVFTTTLTLATPAPTRGASPAPTPRPTPTPEPFRPITAVAIPSIGLESEVVPPLLEKDGVVTWDVPPFVAGHAEGTAGAGQPGNAVLFGHVSSLRSGDVFRNLERVAMGDLVTIGSEERRFAYRVFDIRSVDRTDVSVMDPTEDATITLITCTGRWLPFERDYSERLVVQARLETRPLVARDVGGE